MIATWNTVDIFEIESKPNAKNEFLDLNIEEKFVIVHFLMVTVYELKIIPFIKFENRL